MPDGDAPKRPSFPWWVILCLVGLDYFSSIAYLPSIAAAHVRELSGFTNLSTEHVRALGPVAALGVVVITLFGALPIYLYVVGHSPHGKGGIGLLEHRASGWAGKLLILALLGFVAADFVLTRSLSTSDAAVHVLGNTYYQQHASWLFKTWLPGQIPFLNEQLGVSLALAVLAFGFYFFLVGQLSRGLLGLAVAVVVFYLAVNAAVFAAAWSHIQANWGLVTQWENNLRPAIGDIRGASGGTLAFLALLALITFPPMAIGLSGFELTMASAPLVNGSPADDPKTPAWRIFNTRVMMIVAALIMCVLVLASVFVVTLLVPDAGLIKGGEVQHRSLAYLAHGGGTRPLGGDETRLGPAIASWAGPDFGTLYDLATIMTLCLAGASATVTLRDIVPDFLTRFGMQLDWARQTGVILHLFNATILVTTIVFKASVADQQWAYSASVLALLFGASLAALLDVRHAWKDSWLFYPMQVPFLLVTALFFLMGLLITIQRPSGVLIGLGFVAVVMVTASVSRWLRSTEPRFSQFRFASDAAKDSWDTARVMEFQVLVPHVPGGRTLAEKEAEIRASHRLGPDVPILFVEVLVGDPSAFAVEPVLDTAEEEGRTVLRVTEATSVPHAIAAIALAFSEMGRPPEVHFAWADESPFEANLNFVLLGQGNVPWMVHELVRKAVKDPAKRPRVIVG